MKVTFRITKVQTNSYLYSCFALPEGENPVQIQVYGMFDDLVYNLLPLMNPYFVNALCPTEFASRLLDIAQMDNEYSFDVNFYDIDEFTDVFKGVLFKQ